MGNSSYLTSLVQSGADAQSNLYKATFTFSASTGKGLPDSEVKNVLGAEDFEELSVRLTKFDSPSRSIQYTSLPYQNININIPVESSTLDNKLSLSFRMDSNYKLYNLLEKSIPLNRDGTWNEEKDFTDVRWSQIKVEAFSNIGQGKEGLEEISNMSWVFSNCQLLNIPSLSYSYDSSNSIVITCDFLYSKCGSESQTGKNVTL